MARHITPGFQSDPANRSGSILGHLGAWVKWLLVGWLGLVALVTLAFGYVLLTSPIRWAERGVDALTSWESLERLPAVIQVVVIAVFAVPTTVLMAVFAVWLLNTFVERQRPIAMTLIAGAVLWGLWLLGTALFPWRAAAFVLPAWITVGILCVSMLRGDEHDSHDSHR